MPQNETNDGRQQDEEELLAVDIRSVTVTGSSALISIPRAKSTICSDEEVNALMRVFDEGDSIRVEASIDKPDSSND